MRVEKFRLLDDTTIDTSNIERDYMKLYLQHRA